MSNVILQSWQILDHSVHRLIGHFLCYFCNRLRNYLQCASDDRRCEGCGHQLQDPHGHARLQGREEQRQGLPGGRCVRARPHRHFQRGDLRADQPPQQGHHRPRQRRRRCRMVLWKGTIRLFLVVKWSSEFRFSYQALIFFYPGGDILSIHGHRADVSVRDVAGWGRSGWPDREGAVRDGLSQAEKTEECVLSSKSHIPLMIFRFEFSDYSQIYSSFHSRVPMVLVDLDVGREGGGDGRPGVSANLRREGQVWRDQTGKQLGQFWAGPAR